VGGGGVRGGVGVLKGVLSKEAGARGRKAAAGFAAALGPEPRGPPHLGGLLLREVVHRLQGAADDALRCGDVVAQQPARGSAARRGAAEPSGSAGGGAAAELAMRTGPARKRAAQRRCSIQ
jgi:hypothetical protein